MAIWTTKITAFGKENSRKLVGIVYKRKFYPALKQDLPYNQSVN